MSWAFAIKNSIGAFSSCVPVIESYIAGGRIALFSVLVN